MKVQITIEQDYCPYTHDCLGCCERNATFEADVPATLIGPISKPTCVGVSAGWDLAWEGIRPPEKRDMLLELLLLEAERVWEKKLHKHQPLTLVDPSLPRRA